MRAGVFLRFPRGMRVSIRRLIGLSSLITLVACGGEIASVPTQVAPIPPPVEGAGGSGGAKSHGPVTSDVPPPVDPHGLAVAAAACWFGGLWGDALGEAIERKAMDEMRCLTVSRSVWGGEDRGHFEELRAVNPAAVADLMKRVGTDTPVGKELQALSEAQREALEARRAGDRVKRDVAREPEKLTSDEAAATAALTSGKALDALLKLDDGDLTHEAHALGVMTAMERLDRSRGLPKHLKVYAMEAALQSLFGIAPPAMPDDATKPLPKGAYLAFVAEAAKAAGHAVPDSAKTPKDRESLAWAGVLQGISDKLKPDVDAISKDTPLADVVGRVAHRLETQYQAELNALGTAKPAAAGKTPAAATKGPAAAPAKAPAAKAPATTPAKTPATTH